MGFFDKAKETFREKTRDKVYTALKSIGVEAKLAENGRAEENIKCGFGIHSLGIIDIGEGPIHWVNIRIDVNGTNWIDYGVPDPRLSQSEPKVLIQARFQKTLFGLGRVVDLVWQGEDSSLGILHRLNSDMPLKNTLMRTNVYDFTIINNNNPGCWIISVAYPIPPTEELWNCYQSIAEHLLSEWV
jgi:hypothetical protein